MIDDLRHPTPDADGLGLAGALVDTSMTGATPRISSDELFAGSRELAIDHNGRRYQLRITQAGKLILTA